MLRALLSGRITCLGFSVGRKTQNLCDLELTYCLFPCTELESSLIDDGNQQQSEKWIIMPQHVPWTKTGQVTTFFWLDWLSSLILGLSYNSWSSTAFSCIVHIAPSSTSLERWGSDVQRSYVTCLLVTVIGEKLGLNSVPTFSSLFLLSPHGNILMSLHFQFPNL